MARNALGPRNQDSGRDCLLPKLVNLSGEPLLLRAFVDNIRIPSQHLEVSNQLQPVDVFPAV
jgi:hypothetical protein